MQVTINSGWIKSGWKNEENIVNQNLFYIETSIGKIYSPIQILFENIWPDAVISEEKLLMALASHELKPYNETLYSKLVNNVTKKSPQYIVDELFRYCESRDGVRTLFEEESICNKIKDDKVCQYYYFDLYYYDELKENKKLDKSLFSRAANSIRRLKQVNKFNYMGVSFFYNTDFLIRNLSQDKMIDEDISKYLIPNVSDDIKNDSKFWLYLIPCPDSYISLTTEEFRIEHYKEYKEYHQNKKDKEKRKILAKLYLSLSSNNRLRYSYLFKELKQNKEDIITKKVSTSKLKKVAKASLNVDFNELFNSFSHLELTPENLEFLEMFFKKYYLKYLETMKKENTSFTKNDIIDFLESLFKSYKNFNIIYNDEDITVKDFYFLIELSILFNSYTQHKLVKYILTKRKEELHKFNKIIFNTFIENKYLKRKEVFNNVLIDSIISSKVLLKIEKEIILSNIINKQCSGVELNYLLRLEEENLLINEDFQNTGEIPSVFEKLYQNSSEEMSNSFEIIRRVRMKENTLY